MELVAHDLLTQRLLIILPPGTPRSGGRSIAMGELERIPFIAAPTGTSSRRLLDEAFGAAGVTPQIAVVTAQRDAILPLVLAGAGAALVPETLADEAVRLGATIARPDPADHAACRAHPPPGATRPCGAAVPRRGGPVSAACDSYRRRIRAPAACAGRRPVGVGRAAAGRRRLPRDAPGSRGTPSGRRRYGRLSAMCTVRSPSMLV